MVHDEIKLKKFANTVHSDIKNLELLARALTHRSYIGDNPNAISNERLEFLGDSVVGIVAAEYLYTTFPERKEGELAKAKSVAVSEPVLANAARALGIDAVLCMSSGEASGGGRSRDSMLADAYEAVIAVVFLDCGLEAARTVILRGLADVFDDIKNGQFNRDYKTALQEIVQAAFKEAPVYLVTSQTGADHDKTFTVEVQTAGQAVGKGTGKNKKQAEQAAAKAAMHKVRKMVGNDGNVT